MKAKNLKRGHLASNNKCLIEVDENKQRRFNRKKQSMKLQKFRKLNHNKARRSTKMVLRSLENIYPEPDSRRNLQRCNIFQSFSTEKLCPRFADNCLEFPAEQINPTATSSFSVLESMVEVPSKISTCISNLSMIDFLNLNNGEVSHSTLNDSGLLNVSCSTPIKSNFELTFGFQSKSNSTNIFDASNCFGFDEPETIEEPLVSPIRPPGSESNKEIVHVVAPRESCVDVSQVIKKLNFETEGYNDDAHEWKKTPNKIPIEAIIDDEEEFTITKSFIKCSPDVSINKMKTPRRSYERPAYLRKKKVMLKGEVTSEEDEDEEEQETVTVHHVKQKNKKKEKKGQTKKEEMEMEKWIKAFNSQCQEVEGFDLCVE